MSDKAYNFHNFALKSSLFKGHRDWYFCLLKSERIAHVLSILAENSDEERLRTVLQSACQVPSLIAYLAAGEVVLPQVLAEIFSLTSSLRLLATNNVLTKETTRILLEEYEALSEKLDAGTRLSPFMTSDDFLLQPMIEKVSARPASVAEELSVRGIENVEILKDNSKGQNQGTGKKTNRSEQILTFVQQNKGVSIKSIASVIKNCSEKTIQRELTLLIKQGLVRRVGERRWSLYEPV